MNIFVELSLIIVITTIVAGIMRVLKQPLVIGYILTGFIIGPYLVGRETVETFSQFGISILLFIVGLSLSPKVIKEVGRTSLIIGLAQVISTTFLGFLVATALGFSPITAFYIALALTFSSTIIILKLLSDKKDLEKLYGRVIVGLLLVQDIITITILIFLSAFSGSTNIFYTGLFMLFKGLILTLTLAFASLYVLPRLGKFFAKSQEYLFLFSIGWGLGMATLFSYLGFSTEIGALIAGVTFSVSPYAQEMSSKLKPLRDFFVIMFFILLGSKTNLLNLSNILPAVIIFSLFVLVAKPVIMMVLGGLLGYSKRTLFMSGLTTGQISEFSLILVLLGLKLGHINQDVLSIITLVGLISIAGSTYLVLYAEKIYPHLSEHLNFFQRKPSIKETDILSSHDVILFGCNRVGYDFIKVFRKLGQGFLSVDFDPEIVSELLEKGINCRYGDAEDGEFLDELNLNKAKIVVSTIPDFETNAYLLLKIRKMTERVIVILISYNLDEAIKLYEDGATYVIMPHFISGEFAAGLANRVGFDINNLKDKRHEHIQYLKERKALGHAHPHWVHHA